MKNTQKNCSKTVALCKNESNPQQGLDEKRPATYLPALQRKLKSQVKTKEKVLIRKKSYQEEEDNLDDLIKVKSINVAAKNIYLKIVEVILSQDSKICLAICKQSDE